MKTCNIRYYPDLNQTKKHWCLWGSQNEPDMIFFFNCDWSNARQYNIPQGNWNAKRLHRIQATCFPPGLVFLPRPLTYLLFTGIPFTATLSFSGGWGAFPFLVSPHFPSSLWCFPSNASLYLSLSHPPLLLFGAFFYSSEVLPFPQLNSCLSFSGESVGRNSNKYSIIQIGNPLQFKKLGICSKLQCVHSRWKKNTHNMNELPAVQ